MSSSLASSWTVCDRLIQIGRFSKVKRLIPENASVLDFGCGDGAFLRHLNRNVACIGIDRIVPPSAGNLTFIQTDLEQVLPLPSDSIDVITALAVLEHLAAPEQFVSESYRLLKDGGRIILTTPSPAARPVLELLAFRLGLISKNDIADHKKYHAVDELRGLFAAFSSVRISHFQFGLNTLLWAIK